MGVVWRVRSPTPLSSDGGTETARSASALAPLAGTHVTRAVLSLPPGRCVVAAGPSPTLHVLLCAPRRRPPAPDISGAGGRPELSGHWTGNRRWGLRERQTPTASKRGRAVHGYEGQREIRTPSSCRATPALCTAASLKKVIKRSILNTKASTPLVAMSRAALQILEE